VTVNKPPAASPGTRPGRTLDVYNQGLLYLDGHPISGVIDAAYLTPARRRNTDP